MRLWETPVPIPNTTVKTQAADGTALETMWESRWAPDYGDVAQLGEHLPCKQGVESSNLFISTGIERFQMGLYLSWLERTPDKREVGGSSPLKPTGLDLY